MEMTYDGSIVMPCSYALMDEEEMRYVEAGGHLKLVVSEAFARDCVAAGSTGVGTIIGALVGLLGGTVGSIIGGAIGGTIGWVIGGWASRGIHGNKTVYNGWVPFVNPGYVYLR